MSENNSDQIEIKTPFFSSKIAGKNLTLRDVVLLLVFGGMAGLFGLAWTHADSSDKLVKEIQQSNAALLKEIKDSNREQTNAQKNIAFHNCRQACLLEQPPDRRDGAACERVCSHLRP